MSDGKRARRAHVIVVSDRSARGEREDATGPALVRRLGELGYRIDADEVSIVLDEQKVVRARLIDLVNERVDLVVTTGGTGASPRDVTPDATLSVIARELPGFGELMRRKSYETVETAIGSRATAGVVGSTFILNLPGSPKGALECLEWVAGPAAHVLDLLDGEARECGEPID